MLLEKKFKLKERDHWKKMHGIQQYRMRNNGDHFSAKIGHLCDQDWPFCDSSNTVHIIEHFKSG